MRIAIYARTATHRSDDDPLSLRGQVAQVSEWAAANGHQVVDIYEEPMGVAGETHRPMFERMVRNALSSERPYDALVACSMSRFCRDIALYGSLLETLRRASIQLVSTTEPIVSDKESLRLQRQFIRLMDEFARREQAKHVVKCMHANARQGYFNGSRPPFGYAAEANKLPGSGVARRSLVVAPDEARVVRTIFALLLRGLDGRRLTAPEIAALLNDRGTLCRGKRWKPQTIRRVLANAAYTGTRYFNQRDGKTKSLRPWNEWIAVPIPPIITQHVFDETRAALIAGVNRRSTHKE